MEIFLLRSAYRRVLYGLLCPISAERALRFVRIFSHWLPTLMFFIRLL